VSGASSETIGGREVVASDRALGGERSAGTGEERSMRWRTAESAASVPPALPDGSWEWLDGVGGGGPGSMLLPLFVGPDMTVAVAVEEEAAMEMPGAVGFGSREKRCSGGGTLWC
jgi:hypothetical protein